MIREIENRRSIRKYKPDEIERKLIDEIIYSASLAPSAKNRQPWKFIVYQGKEKDKLVDVMHHGINSEKTTHELMPCLLYTSCEVVKSATHSFSVIESFSIQASNV